MPPRFTFPRDAACYQMCEKAAAAEPTTAIMEKRFPVSHPPFFGIIIRTVKMGVVPADSSRS
jgi:hypothetical protein